jgi:putative tricarboxylic transport membrane protein
MQSTSMRRRVDWLHLALLVVLAGVVAWYLFDAVHASHRIENLIFVVPVGAFALSIAAGAAVGLVRAARRADGGEVEARTPVDARTIALMAAFAVYVGVMDRIGFDVASVLFVGAALWLQGERRWPLLLIYTPAFALGACYGFKQMLPYPMPTTLF